MTEPAVGASVWASGSHVWNGNIGTLIAKPRKNAKKSQIWSSTGRRRRDRRQLLDREGRRVPGALVAEEPRRVQEVERDDAEQHQDGAGQRVEEELDRRVEPPLPSPDADQEVHRHEHHFPEDVEEEEVEAAERPDHERLQEQQQDVVLLQALGDRRVGTDDGDDAHERRQQEQHERDPVDAEVVLDAERRDPGGALDELVARLAAVEGEPERQRDEEVEQGRAGRDGLDRPPPSPAGTRKTIASAPTSGMYATRDRIGMLLSMRPSSSEKEINRDDREESRAHEERVVLHAPGLRPAEDAGRRPAACPRRR